MTSYFHSFDGSTSIRSANGRRLFYRGLLFGAFSAILSFGSIATAAPHRVSPSAGKPLGGIETPSMDKVEASMMERMEDRMACYDIVEEAEREQERHFDSYGLRHSVPIPNYCQEEATRSFCEHNPNMCKDGQVWRAPPPTPAENARMWARERFSNGTLVHAPHADMRRSYYDNTWTFLDRFDVECNATSHTIPYEPDPTAHRMMTDEEVEYHNADCQSQEAQLPDWATNK